MKKQPGGCGLFPSFCLPLTFSSFPSPPLAAVLTSVVCQREEAEVHLNGDVSHGHRAAFVDDAR